MLTGLFKGARFGPFSNLHTCILLVEMYRFGQCLGWRCSNIYTFFPFQVVARLEMRHTRLLGAGFPTNAYVTL